MMLLSAFVLLLAFITTASSTCDQLHIGHLPNLAHGLSGELYVEDEVTLTIEEFYYDGYGPDAYLYFYEVGDETDRTGGGIFIDIAEGMSKFAYGVSYSNNVLTFTMPTGYDVYDIGHFTIWCKAARQFFTSIEFPANLQLNCDSATTPTLTEATTMSDTAGTTAESTTAESTTAGTTAESTTAESTTAGTTAESTTAETTAGTTAESTTAESTTAGTTAESTTAGTTAESTTAGTTAESTTAGTVTTSTQMPTLSPDGNCIALSDSVKLRWSVNEESTPKKVTFTLCSANANPDSAVPQYVGFGLSGGETVTKMLEADPIIAWIDQNGEAHAEDYYLSAYEQCRDGAGVCPDQVISLECSDDVEGLVTGTRENGVDCITFSRAVDTGDTVCDKQIKLDQAQYIVWAVGSLGETAFKHFTRASASTPPIHLGREPLDECDDPMGTDPTCQPFTASRIEALEGTTFVARIGNSGLDRGYIALTGKAGWGISWYINGSLIPELVLRRGETYTFKVEGGDDPIDTANYHPFYITDYAPGGRILNTEEEKANEQVFAGFDASDNPIGVGRLCEYVETEESKIVRESCGSVEEYLRALGLQCRDGEPGVFTWTPDRFTPDEVYYQCATHLNLGWKITLTNAQPTTTGTSPTIPSGAVTGISVTNTLSMLFMLLFITTCAF